jgi:hypothetical protein
MRHGMTIGELARLFNDRFGINAKLEVVKMQNWSRGLYGDATGLPWVLPSPNIPTVDAAVVYPGTVLLEGTNISEGRGTTKPFELVGAPWAEPQSVSNALNGLGLPGVQFRPALFEPTFHKHAAQPCGGCQIHVTNRSVFRGRDRRGGHRGIPRGGTRRVPVARAAGEYEHVKPPIDILCGHSRPSRRTRARRDGGDARGGVDRRDGRLHRIREVLLYSGQFGTRTRI